MKISFVIPAYNEESLLAKCLDSILREIEISACEAEIIVVNNASTDRTKQIALSYSAVDVLDEPQKGIVRARQLGYLSAKGELIANVDADNILPTGWLRKALAQFSKNHRLVALSGPLVYHDLSRPFNVLVGIWYKIAYIVCFLNHFVLRRGGMLQGGNFVVKKLALDQIGGYNTNIHFYGEDADVARRMQRMGRIKFELHLPMYSSGRRIAAEGILLTAFRYAINYAWIMVFEKPLSNGSTDIRIGRPAHESSFCPSRWTRDQNVV